MVNIQVRPWEWQSFFWKKVFNKCMLAWPNTSHLVRYGSLSSLPYKQTKSCMQAGSFALLTQFSIVWLLLFIKNWNPKWQHCPPKFVYRSIGCFLVKHIQKWAFIQIIRFNHRCCHKYQCSMVLVFSDDVYESSPFWFSEMLFFKRLIPLSILALSFSWMQLLVAATLPQDEGMYSTHHVHVTSFTRIMLC